MKFIIHTDGGARGNPGPAAVGVVIQAVADNGKDSVKRVVSEFGKKIGETTNNTAEYTAVIEALKYLISLDEQSRPGESDEVLFYLDSTLVVHQINGLYKVKEPHLRELLTSVRILESGISATIRYAAVPREQNRRADFFVNHALDS